MINYNVNNISDMLFFDIETVREYQSFSEFSSIKNLENWKKTSAKFYADALLITPPSDAEVYLSKAGLYPEYGKIVCIAFGWIEFDENKNPIKKLYNIIGMDEKEILNKIQIQLNGFHKKNPNLILCGHNIVEFDIPFLVKRMIKHEVSVPQLLQIAITGKPWEIKVTDTMKDWKMGTSKFLSLDTICEFLNIPSSKQGDVNGSNLGEYFWNSLDDEKTKLNKIATYCRGDVSVVMDLALRLSKS